MFARCRSREGAARQTWRVRIELFAANTKRSVECRKQFPASQARLRWRGSPDTDECHIFVGSNFVTGETSERHCPKEGQTPGYPGARRGRSLSNLGSRETGKSRIENQRRSARVLYARPLGQSGDVPSLEGRPSAPPSLASLALCIKVRGKPWDPGSNGISLGRTGLESGSRVIFSSDTRFSAQEPPIPSSPRPASPT